MFRHESDVTYLLLYVDDITLITSTTSFLTYLMSRLSHEFAINDLVPFSYFGCCVSHTSTGLFLNQTKYDEEIIERVHMTLCKPTHTPVDTRLKLSASSGDSFLNPISFRSLMGALQYLTITRPNILCRATNMRSYA